ncbi:MAG: hypothetical protein P8Y13_08460, partial [Deinococcales bacterium]
MRAAGGPGPAPPRLSVAGLVAAAVVGALSNALTVGGWALSATIFGGLDVTYPLPWALLLGGAMGTALALWRGPRDSSWSAVMVIGLAGAALWLVVSRGRPLGPTPLPFGWGAVPALLAGLLATHLTRYGLRDLKLGRLRRTEIEILLLRALRAVGFTFFGTVVAFPFYFMVASSLKSRAEMLARPTFLGVDLHQPLGSLLVGYR